MDNNDPPVDPQLYRTDPSSGKPALVLPIKITGDETMRRYETRGQPDLTKVPLTLCRKNKRNRFVQTIGNPGDTIPKRGTMNPEQVHPDFLTRAVSNDIRLESDRRRRQKSYDNYLTNKVVYSPKRVSVFDTDGNSTKPTLADYTIQKIINNIDFYANPAFVQDIMYKARYIEEENKRLITELEDRDAEIQLLQTIDVNKEKKGHHDWWHRDSENSQKHIRDLENQLSALTEEKQNLEQRTRQLEESLKEEEYKLQLKMEANYRAYMEEHERRVVLDLMTNGEAFQESYFKEHIVKLNNEIDALKKAKTDRPSLPLVNSGSQEVNSLIEHVKELEAENKTLQARYYEFKAAVQGKNHAQTLENYAHRVIILEEQLREVKKKYNEINLARAR